MNKERLLLLAEKMESLPKHAGFDLREWIWIEDEDEDGYDDAIDNIISAMSTPKSFDTLLECGTTCCAVGWACAMPEFKLQGLGYCGVGPTFNNKYGWAAVSEFFDITTLEAEGLFQHDSPRYVGLDHIKPTDVARAIRDLVANE